MGSDLSLVLRTCVPVPHLLHRQQPHPGNEGKEGTEFLPLYTELRLVEGNSFNPQTLMALSDTAAFSPAISAAPLRLLVADCSPQTLTMLDFRDPSSFFYMHEELCRTQCAGRIGLVVDPSVCIGERLYTAEQRYLFTQCLSIFFSKLVLLLKDLAVTGTLTKAVNVDDETEIPSDLISTRPNSPCGEDVQLRHELFLVDLQHGLLDDVSGPWIVRDLADHMGRVLHHHAALSLLGGQNSSFSLQSGSLQDTPTPLTTIKTTASTTNNSNYFYYYGTNVNSASNSILASEVNTDQVLSSPDPVQFGFCSSLRQINLSHNNMSRFGLRKCLTELFQQSNREVLGHVKSLEVIDVRRNEESLEAQCLVAEMFSSTNIHVLIGSSGRRWRHTSSDSGTGVGIGAYKLPGPAPVPYNSPVSLRNCEPLFSSTHGASEKESNEVNLNMLPLQRQLDRNANDMRFPLINNRVKTLLTYQKLSKDEEEEALKENCSLEVDATVVVAAEGISASPKDAGETLTTKVPTMPSFENGSFEGSNEEREPVHLPLGESRGPAEITTKDPVINDEVPHTCEPPNRQDGFYQCLQAHLYDVRHDKSAAVAAPAATPLSSEINTIEKSAVTLPEVNLPKETPSTVLSPLCSFPQVSKRGRLGSGMTGSGAVGNSPTQCKKPTLDSSRVKRLPTQGGITGSGKQGPDSKRSYRASDEVIAPVTKCPKTHRERQSVANTLTRSPNRKYAPHKKRNMQTPAAASLVAATASNSPVQPPPSEKQHSKLLSHPRSNQ